MFKLKENETNVKTEFLAGVTTFFTMVYIVVVNPTVLADAGVPFEQVFTATIIATVIGTLWMALMANYPIAIAPGMGMNAYFAYSVVGMNGVTYEIAFSAVFIAGLIFVILSFTTFRKVLIKAIPNNLRSGITAGIGLFIAFIGLRQSELIVAHPSNLVTLGDLHSPLVLFTLFGLVVTLILMALKIHGALFFGMIATAMLAFFTGYLSFDTGFVKMPSLPDGLIVSNPITALVDVWDHLLFPVVFSFLMVTIFDTTGTMIGVAQQAGLMKGNKMPRVQQALLADSLAATVGPMFGTTPTSAYVESSSGVAVGGRTGLTTVIVAMLFILAAFFSPLVSAVSSLAAITSPALIIVGSLMIRAVNHINWQQIDEAFPAFLIILTMPLTSSIATGIAVGFISHPILKIASKKWREIHPLLYLFAILFLLQLAFVPQ